MMTISYFNTPSAQPPTTSFKNQISDLQKTRVYTSLSPPYTFPNLH